jgi:hypothetical protein
MREFENFNRALSNLIGLKPLLHEVKLVLRFEPNAHEEYELELFNCGCKVLHNKFVLAEYQAEENFEDKHKISFSKLTERKVTKAQINPDDLSVSIEFEDGYTLLVQHNADKEWSYRFVTRYDGGPFGSGGYRVTVKEGKLTSGSWNS